MFLLKGALVGLLTALPIGPVAVALFDVTLRERHEWRWVVSAFLAGAVYCVHTVFALTCAALIDDGMRQYPVHIYVFMGVAICYVAWKSWVRNVRMGVVHESSEYTESIYGPGLLSLLCPFTSFLMLNIFTSDASLRQEIPWTHVTAISFGASVGGGLTYCTMMGIVRFCSKRVSKRLVLIFTRLAPWIIVSYALRSFWLAVRCFMDGVYVE